MAPRKIERKDTQFERQITYGKRSQGLLKKAFELSVLCDVDVALIILERILQEYIQHEATIPEKNAGEVDNSVKPVISQEINEETKKLILLQELQRKLIPDMGTSKSIHELEERKRFLGEALHKISQKKKTMLSRFNIGTCSYISQHNLQRGEQLQQGYRTEIEAPFSTQPQQTCGINQIGLSPPVPEPFEISNDRWSLQHIVDQNLPQKVPVPVQQIGTYLQSSEDLDRILQMDWNDWLGL
ncbi:Agamous-like MADS-box protein AGL11 [Carex littledalei]|uniref:Agamous-like MADS-box protein AGL11 n=1 Tax=Carex littledalei TaxID=544730 RepID=A0A833W339_9POAL|nr:Agamous-like MADS-box protein AGL11 [Carex littledalei]